MAGVAAIVRCQWVAYWRRFRRSGQQTAGSQGVVLILACLIFVKYLQLLRIAALELSRGVTPRLEGVLAVIFLAWLYPVMGNALLIPARSLLYLPLSVWDLLRIRMVSLLIPVYAWMIVAGSGALFYPLAYTPHPLAAMVATSIFIVLAYGVGLAVSHLLLIASGRTALLLLLLCAALSAGPLRLIAKSRPEWMAPVLSGSPTHLVANTAVASAPWGSLLSLSLLALLSLWLAAWSFRRSLLTGPPTRAQSIPILRRLSFPGRFGGLVIKDLRHFRRLLDPYFALMIAALCGTYLINAPAPAPELFWMFMILFFTLNVTLAFDSFGLDEPSGFDRYKLLPLSGRMIILSKNLMFVTITGVQALVLLGLAAWRFGLFTSLLNTIEVVVLMLAYMAWGNWMSVRYPVKLQFYRVASGGPLVEAIMGLCLANLPAIVCLYLLLSDGSRAAGKMVLMKMVLIMLLCLAIYLVSTVRSGRYLELRSDEIRVVLR